VIRLGQRKFEIKSVFHFGEGFQSGQTKVGRKLFGSASKFESTTKVKLIKDLQWEQTAKKLERFYALIFKKGTTCDD
jgi:hypothetical protein